MRPLVITVFISVLALYGCAEQMVQEDAKSSCAKQGKRAFILSAHEKGVPLLIDAASAQYYCVAPQDVVKVQAPFGAEVINHSDFNGVGILGVSPGMSAEKAGIKAGDIVYEFGDHSVSRSGELQAAIDATAAGMPVPVKLRRNDKEIAVTVRF
jgi:predicted metalloprotease with PDZ domain